MATDWSRDFVTRTGFRFHVRPARPSDEAALGAVHFPEALRQNIVSIIGPGTTLLITRDSLKSAGTGTRLTVIATDVK